MPRRAAPFLGTLLLLGAQSTAGGGGANLAPGMQHCGETMPVRPRAARVPCDPYPTAAFPALLAPRPPQS